MAKEILLKSATLAQLAAALTALAAGADGAAEGGEDSFPTADAIGEMDSDQLDDLCEKIGLESKDLDEDEKKALLTTVYLVGTETEVESDDLKSLILALGLKYVKKDDEANLKTVQEYLSGDADEDKSKNDEPAEEDAADIEAGSEVTWEDDGDTKTGTVKSIKGDNAKVMNDEDEIVTVAVEDLTLAEAADEDAEGEGEAEELAVGDEVTWTDEEDAEQTGTIKSIKGDNAKVKNSEDEIVTVAIEDLSRSEAAEEDADEDDEKKSSKEEGTDYASVVEEKAEYPKEALMQKRLDAYNKVADEKINVKKLGVKKAYAKLLELLVTTDDEIAEWGEPYIREDAGWCCGIELEDTKIKGEKEQYGKCLVTGKIFSLNNENNFVEYEA